jgi:hypothetical protein
MMSDLRRMCRNPRCRCKLAQPVDNEHHGFCSPGCHAGFYRKHCLVCEQPIQQPKGEGYVTCASGPGAGRNIAGSSMFMTSREGWLKRPPKTPQNQQNSRFRPRTCPLAQKTQERCKKPP